jgi:hypothetical protein
MVKDMLIKIFILILLLSSANQQTSRNSKKRTQTDPKGIVSMLINVVLPGPSDASIMTRISNKLQYIIPGVIMGLGSFCLGWLKFFRKTKTRE